MMKRAGILSILMAVAATACGTVGGHQLPVNEKPIRFVDSQTGDLIERVLLIPQYSKSTGVSTGGGHGPGAMTDSLFVAPPVVYGSGELLQLRQPDSKGLSIPGAFVGQGLSLKGVTVIAPQHAATWVWQLWDRPPDFQVPLAPMGDAWPAYRDRFLAQLDQSRIRGADLTEVERAQFSIIPEFSIDVRLSQDDRDRVRQFVRGSAAR